MLRIISCSARRWLAVVAAGLIPSLSAAQAARRPVTVGLGGGATVPVGDFAEDVKTGWNGLAFLQYHPVGGPWAVRAEAGYHRAGYTDDFLTDVGAATGDDLSNAVTQVGVGALYLAGEGGRSTSPYLVGGLGLYRLTASLRGAGGVSLTDSENGFGFNGGAGVRFGGSTALFVEARFHQFSITSDEGAKSTYRMVPVVLGFTF